MTVLKRAVWIAYGLVLFAPLCVGPTSDAHPALWVLLYGMAVALLIALACEMRRTP